MLNAGVVSYSPIIYSRKIRSLLDEGFRCDHVVTLIDISDIQDDALVYQLDLKGNVIDRPGQVPDGGMSGGRGTIRRILAKYTLVTNRVLRRLRGLLTKGRDANHRRHPRSAWTLDDTVFEDYGRDGRTPWGGSLTIRLGPLAWWKQVARTWGASPRNGVPRRRSLCFSLPCMVRESRHDSTETRAGSVQVIVCCLGTRDYLPLVMWSRRKSRSESIPTWGG